MHYSCMKYAAGSYMVQANNTSNKESCGTLYGYLVRGNFDILKFLWMYDVSNAYVLSLCQRRQVLIRGPTSRITASNKGLVRHLRGAKALTEYTWATAMHHACHAGIMQWTTNCRHCIIYYIYTCKDLTTLVLLRCLPRYSKKGRAMRIPSGSIHISRMALPSLANYAKLDARIMQDDMTLTRADPLITF